MNNKLHNDQYLLNFSYWNVYICYYRTNSEMLSHDLLQIFVLTVLLIFFIQETKYSNQLLFTLLCLLLWGNLMRYLPESGLGPILFHIFLYCTECRHCFFADVTTLNISRNNLEELRISVSGAFKCYNVFLSVFT